MKFIKINEDMYINVQEIQGFVVREVDGAFWIQAGVNSLDPVNLVLFETRNAARAYLAELVAKINIANLLSGDD